MVEVARPELYDALMRSGRINRSGSPFGANYHDRTQKQARETLSRFLVNIDQLQVEKYRRHGLAKIDAPINYATVIFFVDIAPIRDITKPSSVWVNSQWLDSLSILISSGKQIKDGSVEFDENRTLEALAVRITPKSRTEIPSPYEAEITPIYSD